jgi:hypothetical protein
MTDFRGHRLHFDAERASRDHPLAAKLLNDILCRLGREEFGTLESVAFRRVLACAIFVEPTRGPGFRDQQMNDHASNELREHLARVGRVYSLGQSVPRNVLKPHIQEQWVIPPLSAFAETAHGLFGGFLLLLATALQAEDDDRADHKPRKWSTHCRLRLTRYEVEPLPQRTSSSRPRDDLR